MIVATFTPMQEGVNYPALTLIYKKKGVHYVTQPMASEADYNALLELYYRTPLSRA